MLKSRLWPFLICIGGVLLFPFPTFSGTSLVAWGDNFYGQTNIPAGLTNVVAIAGSSSHSLALNRDGTLSAWGWNSYGQGEVPPNIGKVIAIACGSSHNVVLTHTGSVVSWGWNFYGQTNVPSDLGIVSAVAAGGSHSLALRAKGTVAGWGSDEYGQATVPYGLNNVVAIAAGGWHSLALKPDGTIVAWGYNGYGQTNVPTDLTNVVAIAAGAAHSVALQLDGTVRVWGNNDYGQADVPPDLANVIAIASGAYHVLALKADGTVSAWGYNFSGQTNVPAGLSGVVAISARSLALIGDGSPFITTPLQACTAVLGKPAHFRMAATGAWPLSYVWHYNGTTLLGNVTNSMLWIDQAQLSDAGIYSVIVSNRFGMKNTIATLQVASFVVTVPPKDATTWLGGNTQFSVSADSASPLSYQWLFGTEPLVDGPRVNGSTTPLLQLTDVQGTDAGTYRVVISNTLAIVGYSATLTVTNRMPLITCQPQDQTIDANSNAVFTVCVSSPYPYTAKWFHDGFLIQVLTNQVAMTNQLVIPDITPEGAGLYWCELSNMDGMTTSWVAELQVQVHAPVFDRAPQNQVVNEGETGAFAIPVSGTRPIFYQWYHTGQPVPGGTSNILVLPSVTSAKAGSYWLIASNIAGVSTSEIATLTVIRSPGCCSVVAWGENFAGQTNVPPGLTNVVAVCAGSSHALALKSDGTVRAWGKSADGQTNVPSGLEKVVALAAGESYSLALKEDGTLAAWGSTWNGHSVPLVLPADLTNVVAISGGDYHLLALTANGNVRAAGYYWDGSSYLAIYVPSMATNVVAVSAGANHNLALKIDGSVIAWGNNSYGQLNVPSNLSNVIAITAGGYHSLALKADGTVVGWGYNSYGQATAPPELNNVVALAAGDQHNVALRADGTLFTWGDGTYGQTNLPAGLAPVLSIDAGQRFNLALRGNGGPYLTAPFPNRTVPAGIPVEFRVFADGMQPLQYQWRSNNLNLINQTNSFLVFSNATLAQSGLYSVVISDPRGIANVYRATLQVLPLIFVVAPQSQLTYTGEVATLSVAVQSAATVTYQWYLDGHALTNDSRISGVTTSQLTIQNLENSDSGSYYVRASNNFGWAQSPSASLVVTNRLPIFTLSPYDQWVNAYGNVFFSVAVTSVYPFTLQWLHDGQPIPGATSSNLFLSNVWTNDAGSYWCVASNREGAVASQAATLTVLLDPPVILQQPFDQMADWDASASFWINASGTPPLYFQWQHDGNNIPGATNSSLSIYPVSGLDAGSYRVFVKNVIGEAVSEFATLFVQTNAPQILVQPVDATTNAGWDVCFEAMVHAAPKAALQWQFNEQDLSGATNSSLCLSLVSSNDQGGYRLIASNYLGMVTSQIAQLTVLYRPPEFVKSPKSQQVKAGSYVVFDCIAVGGPKPLLQWLHNGQPIAGATNNALQFIANSTNQAGAYSVWATNMFGSVTSGVAALSILTERPHYLLEPVGQGAVAGEMAQFSAFADGDPAPEYQWWSNGQPVPGATNSVLTLPHVSLTNAGLYHVIAFNEGGATTSRVAQLVVSLPGPLDHWQWRRPLPQGNDLYCLAADTDLLVARGRAGACIRSADGGLSWQDTGDTAADIYSVAHGNGLWVAAGLSGGVPVIQTSRDGIRWTEQARDLGPGSYFRRLVFGQGRFIGITALGLAYVSTNGIDWSTLGSLSGISPWKIIVGNNLLLALGACTTSSGASTICMLALSSDGLNWIPLPVEMPGSILDGAFGNDRFVLCGGSYVNSVYRNYCLVSSNGFSWVAADFPSPNGFFSKLAYANNRFMALGDDAPGQGATSPDGSNWTLHETGYSNRIEAVLGTGQTFLAVGDKGVILASTNGAEWAARSPGSPLNFRCAAYGNNLYVAVGNEGLLLTSPDGLAWSPQPPLTTANIRSVTFGNGTFVAVGDASDRGAIFLASRNGSDWSLRELFPGYDFYSVTYGQSQFVAVGANGIIATSPDGHAWGRAISATSSRLNAITYNGAQFVAVGRNGAIIISTNAVNWRVAGSPTGYFLQGIAWGNDLYVAAGEYGAVLTSPDGMNWTVRWGDESPFSTRNIEDVQFANGRFIAVGEDGFLASSTNGEIWTPHQTRCQNPLRSVLYARSHVLAVGNNETILQSDFFGPPVLRVRSNPKSEGFEFFVDSESGGTYRLQSSDDLVHWDDIFTFLNTQTTTLFLDAELDFFPQRFYRVVSDEQGDASR